MLSEQTKSKIVKILGKLSPQSPPLVSDSVIGKNSRASIIFSNAEEAQKALEAFGNYRGPWKHLFPYIQHPREGTMIQVCSGV